MMNLLNLIISIDALNSILYCGDFILKNIWVFSFILIGVSILPLVHTSGKMVQKIINGVVTWVPVTAGGLYINEALGNPLELPGQGQQGNRGNQGNTGNNGQGGQGQGNQGGQTGQGNQGGRG
jgi:hypothetical protein